eukprot:scaffold2437_cov395-Prasinococcus_capsulatus_cf.AAC.21
MVAHAQLAGAHLQGKGPAAVCIARLEGAANRIEQVVQVVHEEHWVQGVVEDVAHEGGHRVEEGYR